MQVRRVADADFARVVAVPRSGILKAGEPARPRSLEKPLGRVLISGACIRERIKRMAEEISRRESGGEEFCFAVVLKGARTFFEELIKTMPGFRKGLGKSLRGRVGFIELSSYRGKRTTGEVRVVRDLKMNVKGRRVLVVEDVADTGATLSFLRRRLFRMGAKKVRVCTMLDKPANRVKRVKLDYVGFEIPNFFVAGFGIDYNERFRDLPFIATVGR